MRIVFMGSPALACPALLRLFAEPSADVVGVVTQPDRPSGRRLKIAPCAVKQLAEERGMTVLTPGNVNAPEALAGLRALAPDLIAVVAYGQLLKAGVLATPPRGCVNVHCSLLPKYRGAAPMQWAIVRGETVTGVTTFFLDTGMDTGDIVFQKEEPIRPEDTAGTLGERLAEKGAVLLAETVRAIEEGSAPRRAQAHAEATHARKLRKEDGRINWAQPARDIAQWIRGLNPWPCCFTTLPAASPAGVKPRLFLRVLSAAVEDGAGKPGEVIDVSGAGPLVASGDRAVRLLEVQPEGKSAMSGAACLRGHAVPKGSILGP